MQVCNTYVLGPVFQLAVFLVYRLLVWLVGKTDNKALRNASAYDVCFTLSQVNFLIALVRWFVSTSSMNIMQKGTVDIPSEGWSYDYATLVVLVALAMKQYSHLVFDELKDQLFKTPCLHLLIGANAFFSNLFKKMGQATNRKASNPLYKVLYFLIGALQLYVWVPVVSEWTKLDHCFLDGFVSLTNEINTFVTMSIILLDIIFVIHVSKCIIDVRSAVIGVVLIIVSFYNATVATAGFLMWL